MALTDPTTPAPAAWFDSPLVRHLAGMALTLLIGFLGVKYGITPTPVPAVPLAQPAVVVVTTGGPAGVSSIATK